MEDKIERDLKAIRAVVDIDTTGADIESVVECGKKLASMCGLSAQCMGAAKKRLEAARLKAIKEIEGKYSPSIMNKTIDAMCGEELAIYDYADRLNAAITHQLDYYRSVISLHKTELENSLK